MRPVKNTVEIQRAKRLAREYCQKNGLDSNSLETQKVFFIDGTVIFAQPVTGSGLGLMEDIATQSKPTLVLRMSDDGYTVEQTEYTNRYLSLAHQN